MAAIPKSESTSIEDHFRISLLSPVFGLEEEKEIFALAKETDGKIREVLNALFEKEVCEPLFGNMNLFAYSGGMPVWVNLMLALSDEMNTAMLAEADARDKRIEKYVKKYQKK